MKRTVLTAATLLALTIALTRCNQPVPEEPAKAETTVITEQGNVERGRYLVGIMGCSDCHTPKKMTEHGPEPDMDRLLMGHPATEVLPEVNYMETTGGQWALFSPGLTAAVGPWGTTYAANLTPDDTGLGSWSFEQFKKAMTEGKYKGMDGGRPMMPPMPWQNFTNLTEEDLTAIFTYLKSIKPIENVVPAYAPPAQG